MALTLRKQHVLLDGESSDLVPESSAGVLQAELGGNTLRNDITLIGTK